MSTIYARLQLSSSHVLAGVSTDLLLIRHTLDSVQSCSDTLLIYIRFLMSTSPQEDLHALQYLLLQVRPLQILPWEPSVRPVKFERLDRFPNPMDSLRRQRNHVRIRPHE